MTLRSRASLVSSPRKRAEQGTTRSGFENRAGFGGVGDSSVGLSVAVSAGDGVLVGGVSAGVMVDSLLLPPTWLQPARVIVVPTVPRRNARRFIAVVFLLCDKCFSVGLSNI